MTVGRDKPKSRDKFVYSILLPTLPAKRLASEYKFRSSEKSANERTSIFTYEDIISDKRSRLSASD